MDKLDDLPTRESDVSSNETRVVEKYFGSKKSKSWSNIIKVGVYATLIFILLSNPITESVFNLLPLGNIMKYVVMCLLYFIIFVVIYKFWC